MHAIPFAAVVVVLKKGGRRESGPCLGAAFFGHFPDSVMTPPAAGLSLEIESVRSVGLPAIRSGIDLY